MVWGGEDGSHYLLLTQMQPIMQIWYFNQWQLLVLKADWFLFSSSVVNVVLTPEYKLGLLTYKSSLKKGQALDVGNLFTHLQMFST